MTLAERRYTVEEFFEIAQLPENEEKRLEFDDGDIIDMGSSSRVNTIVGIRIAHFLSAFVIPNDLGFVTGADAGYKQPSGKVRRPDVAFISSKHEISLVGVEFLISPDLAVEIVSPDEDVFKKVNEYFRNGTRLAWLVYPDELTIYVLQLDADGGIHSVPFGIDDTLDGGDVLPGFTLPVRDIFPLKAMIN